MTTTIREISMYASTAVRTWPPAAVRAGFIALAAALLLAAPPVPAADPSPPPASETRIKVTPFPPSVQVDASTSASDDEDSGSKRGKKHRAVVRIDSDSDPDFESFKDVAKTAPWMIGAILLVAGSIFLTPIILLVGVVWYKLRKTRMQNEVLLALAEKGVVPTAQAVDAVTSGVMPEAAAAGASATASASTNSGYQQAITTRRRAVWSDLRRGVLLCAFGLSLAVYSMIQNSSANWLGLMLLFVGIGYIVLWWFEDRHLAQRNSTGGSD
jgi:hypothetical protein